MKTKNAIILLAGMGSRLRPMTETTHKALIKIGGETILERQIRQLCEQNIENIHLVLGYRAQDIRDFISTQMIGKAQFFFYENSNYESTNTGYSLWLVLKHFTESFLLLDGDVVLADKLINLLCQDQKEKNLLLTDTHTEKIDEEAVKCRLDEAHKVIEIGKQVSLLNAKGESIGIGLFQSDWAQALKTHLHKMLENKNNWQRYYEDAMQELLQSKQKLSPLEILSTGEMPWVEIDNADDLKRAMQLFG